MFRTVLLSIIRSLFTVHSAMVYTLYTQLSSRSICSCLKAVHKPVWHIPLLSVQWINCWWWTDECPKRVVSWQNKFVKLVHLVGFITNKRASSYTQTVQKSMSIFIRHNKTHTWGDFRLSLRSRWDLRSSVTLHSAQWVIPCQRFGTTYWPHLQGSRNPISWPCNMLIL
jgi:hypothetical protein